MGHNDAVGAKMSPVVEEVFRYFAEVQVVLQYKSPTFNLLFK